MLISVGISWLDQAEFGPNDRSLDFTHSQETIPAAVILRGSSALWRWLVSLWSHRRGFGYVLPAQGRSAPSSLLSVLSKHLVTLPGITALLCWWLLGGRGEGEGKLSPPEAHPQKVWRGNGGAGLSKASPKSRGSECSLKYTCVLENKTHF